MRLAMKLAMKAQPFPNPRVGAVLVKGGRIIGGGWHRGPGLPHAEMEAIADAKRRTGNPHAARDAALYVTLEPCVHTAKRTPPCTEAIIREGVAKVVYAMGDPNPLVCGKGAEALRKAGVAVEGPTDSKAAASINRRYFAAITRKPLVTIKMAMSADGKSATRTGDSRWISCPESRAMVHRMRAEYGAVMVGAGTIEADDPELTAHGAGRDPCRIIIDGRLSVSPDAKVFRRRDGKAIVAVSQRADRAKALALARRGVRVLVCGKDRVGLRALMPALAALGIRRILIEGGGELNAEALDEGIVDRLLVFVAPKIIGGRAAKPVVGGKGAPAMKDALALSPPKVRRVGADVLLEFKVLRRSVPSR